MRRTAGGGTVISFEETAFAEYWQWAGHEHRLIYKVFPDNVVVVSCRYHYSKT